MSTENTGAGEAIRRLLRSLETVSGAISVPGLPHRNLVSAADVPTPEAMHALANLGASTVGVATEPDSARKDARSSARRQLTPGTQDDAVPGLVETAAAVAAGEIRARDAVARSLQAIASACPLNAFVRLCPEAAWAAAARVDAARHRGRHLPPLAGAPIGHKDILLTRGVGTEAGSRLLAGFVPQSDAAAVEQLSSAGAISLGKLNTHEFATGVTGTVSAAGPTLNPWDAQRVPGGSSAGSAAAVAAGLIPAATGTDTGGSIRIPSACCGVVGLKPTYGRVSASGVIPFAASLDHVGPIARTVADVAAMFEAMTGADRGASIPSSWTIPEALQGVRVGTLRTLVESAVPQVARCVEGVSEALADAGARCVDVGLPVTWPLVTAAAVAIFLWEGGAYHRCALRGHPALYQAPTRSFLGRARLVEENHYRAALSVRRRVAAETAELLQRVDLLLLPTLPTVAPPCNAETVNLPEGQVDVRAAMTRFTRPFNLTGLPALTLPCGLVDGMPAAAQLVGRWLDDERLLAVAGVAERALGHTARPPGHYLTRSANQ